MDYQGGCQCGRIRFRAAGPRDLASVCYCRMCQKASGGPFMGFVRFPANQITWTIPPDIFASSNMVERGFCSQCGTPLTYRYTSTQFISVTINSLDDPDAVHPELSFAPGQMAPWLRSLDSLPREDIDPATTPGLISHQIP